MRTETFKYCTVLRARETVKLYGYPAAREETGLLMSSEGNTDSETKDLEFQVFRMTVQSHHMTDIISLSLSHSLTHSLTL